MKEEDKDLNYWEANARDGYMHTPICVLRYITELEKQLKNCNLQNVSQQSELLIGFLIYLNNKGLINNYDFVYEEEAKKFVKKLINCG